MVSFSRKSAVAEPDAPHGLPAQTVSVPTSAPLAAFPRVNLIPSQIAQEAKVRRAKNVLAVSVVGSLAVVGGLFVVASGQVGSAQEQLDTATARSAALAADATKYADVPKVQADLTSAQSQQALAMSGEVRWSLILNNIALTIPQGVSLTSMKGTITGTSGTTSTSAAAGSTAGVTSVLGNPGIGSLQYEGQALDDPKVAAFLEALARNTGLIDPFATQASASSDAAEAGATGAAKQAKSVNFTASATISAKALSHRYDAKGN